MARGKLFEYAVIYHPKQKKNAAGEVIEEKKSELVVQPTRVIAVTPEEVSISAARSIPENMADKLDCLEILVRPF